MLGEIAQKRLGNANLAGVFPGYGTFKFRGLARPMGGDNTSAPAPEQQQP